MNGFIVAHSSQSLPIMGYNFGSTGPRVLILGGVHGDETEGVIAAYGLLNQFLQSFPYQLRITVIPTFNIDGILLGQRQNARGVDLNRNLPARDWSPIVVNPRYAPGPSANSEPENQGLTKWLNEHQPELILSLHSWHPMLNINGNCRHIAESIAQHTNYKIEESIGYPTPGSLGTYAGQENNWPTLTYEIEEDLSAKDILSIHVPSILEGLKTLEFGPKNEK